MGARHKLNKVAIQGTLIVGALVGLATNSTLIGLITMGALLALCLATGDIRVGPANSPDRRKPRSRRQ